MYSRFFRSYSVLSLVVFIGVYLFELLSSDQTLFGVSGISESIGFTPFDPVSPFENFGIPLFLSFYHHSNTSSLLYSLPIFLTMSWMLGQKLNFKAVLLIQVIIHAGTLLLVSGICLGSFVFIAPISGSWLVGMGFGGVMLFLNSKKIRFFALAVCLPTFVHIFFGVNFSIPVLISLGCSALVGQFLIVLARIERRLN